MALAAFVALRLTHVAEHYPGRRLPLLVAACRLPAPLATRSRRIHVAGCRPLQATDRLPPTLIHHGNADTLVPFSQSKRFVDKAEQLGCRASLKEVPDAGHGWLTMPVDIMAFADWFDRTLLPVAAAGSPH